MALCPAKTIWANTLSTSSPPGIAALIRVERALHTSAYFFNLLFHWILYLIIYFMVSGCEMNHAECRRSIVWVNKYLKGFNQSSTGSGSMVSDTEPNSLWYASLNVHSYFRYNSCKIRRPCAHPSFGVCTLPSGCNFDRSWFWNARCCFIWECMIARAKGGEHMGG